MIALIERTTPHLADRFTTEIINRADGHERYEIESVQNTICLRGTSKSALCAAYYRYLRDFCDMDLSPCGNTEVYACGKPRLPEKKLVRILAHDIRCAFSYGIYENDAYAWDQNRWDFMIDYLAMQGVNVMFMPVGNESVWYYAALKLGINREDAMDFLSSPIYYPLQLAGKLDTFLPLTDTNYLKAQIALGRHIIERMREVGIEPILPAFTGHAPKFIKGYFKQSNLYFVTPWGQFPFTYRVYPDDPLFSAIADALREKQTEYFGTAAYYLADPFLDVTPRVREGSLISQTGEAVLREIRKTNEHAVWVQTGCCFTQQLLHNLPADSALILNTSGDPAFSELGQPYLACAVLNPDGHTVLCGNAEKLLSDTVPQDAAGLAILPDSLAVNPLYSALAFRRLTEDVKDAQSAFIREAVRRWGSDEDCLRDAAKLLFGSCYNSGSPADPVGSIPAARPSTELSHTAPGDTLALHYANIVLCRALERMLSSEGDYTDGYTFDVCDVTRQMLSNYARRLYVGVIEGYRKRDSRLFETATNAFMRVLSDMDRLLCTRAEYNLVHNLYAAGARSEGKTDRQNFEVALLVAHTIFGPPREPEQYDLRWREWSGLVGEYYAKRWHSFFTYLAENFRKRKTISTVCREQIAGRNPSCGNKFYKQLDRIEREWITLCKPAPVSEEETLDVAAELLKKYKPLIGQDVI